MARDERVGHPHNSVSVLGILTILMNYLDLRSCMNVGATNKEYRDNAMCCLDNVFITVQSLKCFVPELPTDTLLEYMLPKLKPFVNLRKLILKLPERNQAAAELLPIIKTLFLEHRSLDHLECLCSRLESGNGSVLAHVIGLVCLRTFDGERPPKVNVFKRYNTHEGPHAIASSGHCSCSSYLVLYRIIPHAPDEGGD